MKRTKMAKEETVEFNAKMVRADLLKSAKALKIPESAAKVMVTEIVKEVGTRVAKGKVGSEEKLNRQIAMVAKKYSADLSYVYQNRGKII